VLPLTSIELRLLVFTRAEAAQELGTSLITLDDYRRRGFLKAIADGKGRVIAYSRADIAKFKDKLSEAELFRAKPGPKRSNPPWKEATV